MTEPQKPYSVIDLEHLTPEQAEQLRFVLSVLSLHQLIHFAARIRRLCKGPGYGKIVVTVQDGEPNLIEAGESDKFLPRLDADKLKSLMGR